MTTSKETQHLPAKGKYKAWRKLTTNSSIAWTSMEKWFNGESKKTLRKTTDLKASSQSISVTLWKRKLLSLIH